MKPFPVVSSFVLAACLASAAHADKPDDIVGSSIT